MSSIYVSDLLTKYLAIKDGELTPLPWKLPYCKLYNDSGLLLNEKLKFIENLNSFQKLKFGYFTPSDEFSEPKLKNEIFRLASYDLDNDWNGKTQQPLIREIGQRIGNLLKFVYIALTQLAQIILLTNYSLTDQNELNGLERILSIAMNSGVNEGKSYLAPAFARFIIPLLFPAAKLREIKENIFAKKLEAELAQKVVDRHKIEETPVFPLDYGGYSLNRIRAHQRPIWPEGVKEQINQFQIDFEPSINNENIFEEQNEFKLTEEIKLERTTNDETIFNEYLKNEWTENNNERKNDNGTKKKQKQTKHQNNVKMTKEKSKVSDSIVDGGVTSSFLNNQSKRLKSSRAQIDGTLLGTLSNRGEVLFKLDIPLPEILPVPPSLMLNHLFEQPVSTWVSPSAKGIKVDDLLNFGELPELSDLLLEPECPEPTLVLQSSSILLELDELPAYLYREHLTKFYKPEKALRDTFRSIGSTKLDRIERVAAKLFFALKGAAMHHSVSSSKPISSIREFVLGTISSLYWRIKGDPLNSIKCLRHSLYNSPNEFIDVPLVSLANIYHQAGFLHSALYTLGKAFETGKNVVAVSPFYFS
uniref:Anaphase-promoting complex subunit 5 n=1 Tax=Meloidogyne javanica TaxID=6303 RepID=A0A915LRZ6_MELJA